VSWVEIVAGRQRFQARAVSVSRSASGLDLNMPPSDPTDARHQPRLSSYSSGRAIQTEHFVSAISFLRHRSKAILECSPDMLHVPYCALALRGVCTSGKAPSTIMKNRGGTDAIGPQAIVDNPQWIRVPRHRHGLAFVARGMGKRRRLSIPRWASIPCCWVRADFPPASEPRRRQARVGCALYMSRRVCDW